MNKFCNIVKDLLPSYAYNLTADETNKFIEEHLIKCEECRKNLENIKNGEKEDKEKKSHKYINFAKKYQTKMYVLRSITIFAIIILIAHIILSFWSASIIYKEVEIARLSYISNRNIGASRNICEEEYSYFSKECMQNGSDYEQQRIRYTLGDTTKAISYYPLKKIKITQISYQDKEIKYLETDNGAIKIRCENNLPETKEEIYEIPDKSDEELDELFSSLYDMFFINSIDTIMHFKVTEDIEDGIKCYIITDRTNDGYHKRYFDRYGLCFKEIQTSNEDTIFKSTRKASLNSVKPEDVAELDNNQYTLVSSEEFNNKVALLLEDVNY